MATFIDEFAVSVKLAALLLLQDGVVSIKDIESIPFVGDREEAYAVARRLVDAFNDTYEVSIQDGGSEGIRIVLTEAGLNALYDKRRNALRGVPTPATPGPIQRLPR